MFYDVIIQNIYRYLFNLIISSLMVVTKFLN